MCNGGQSAAQRGSRRKCIRRLTSVVPQMTTLCIVDSVWAVMMLSGLSQGRNGAASVVTAVSATGVLFILSIVYCRACRSSFFSSLDFSFFRCFCCRCWYCLFLLCFFVNCFFSFCSYKLSLSLYFFCSVFRFFFSTHFPSFSLVSVFRTLCLESLFSQFASSRLF